MRFEDLSFAARLLTGEPVMKREYESELDLAYPADWTIVEDGIRSFVGVPLIFGDTVGRSSPSPSGSPTGSTRVISRSSRRLPNQAIHAGQIRAIWCEPIQIHANRIEPDQ